MTRWMTSGVNLTPCEVVNKKVGSSYFRIWKHLPRSRQLPSPKGNGTHGNRIGIN